MPEGDGECDIANVRCAEIVLKKPARHQITAYMLIPAMDQRRIWYEFYQNLGTDRLFQRYPDDAVIQPNFSDDRS